MAKARPERVEKLPQGMAVKRYCRCSSMDQDALHGNGVRVHNVTKDGFRCTVCSNLIRTK
jgi:hypothetical protein